MLKYVQSVRDELVEDNSIYEKTSSVAETLSENDISYPFLDSVDHVSMDSIAATNGQLLWKEMNKIAKKLSAKLNNKVQTEGNRFVLHNGFKITGVGKGESHKYIPFTLTMDDGQTLTALARNVKNLKSFNPKQPLEVTHWFINKKDATRAIYKHGDTTIDEATTIARLKALVEMTHVKFVANNPDIVPGSAIRDLKDEISAMQLDLSNVVYEPNKSYGEKLKDKEARKNPDKAEQIAKAKELAQIEVDNGTFRPFAQNAEAMKLIEGNEAGEGKDVISAYVDIIEKGRHEAGEKALKEDEEKFDYVVTLPAGSEKYINTLKEAFKEDSELSKLRIGFVNDDVAEDAIAKKDVLVLGEKTSIKTKIKQYVHFASIGYDKTEGKDVRMPSVALIRNAEFIKGKTRLDYSIDHEQNATFITERKEFSVEQDGRGSYYFRAVDDKENWSIKERWLSTDRPRKVIIEKINEALKEDKLKEVSGEAPEAAEDNLSTRDKLKVIKNFIGEEQYSILYRAIKQTNHEFKEVIDRLHETITTMPKTYGQDGKGDEAVAYLHYFNSDSDWYITEKDKSEEQIQAFGLVSLHGGEPELGYISIEELKNNNIELDFYWSNKTVGKLKEGLRGHGDDNKNDDKWSFERDAVNSADLVAKDTSIITNWDSLTEEEKTTLETATTWDILSTSEFVAYDHKKVIATGIHSQPRNGKFELSHIEIRKEAKNEYTLEDLQSHPIYKKILDESMGGVMYNEADKGKYDVSELLEIWNSLDAGQRESAGGITKGLIGFITDGYSKEHQEQFDFNLTATTSDAFEEQLDALAEQIENAGMMDKYEDQLNSLADKLTEMMKAENE